MDNTYRKVFQFLKKDEKEFITGNDLKNMFLTAFDLFKQHVHITNAVNVFPVPDGDTGLNISETLRSIATELHQFGIDNHCGKIISIICRGAFNGCVGNSGIIFSEYLHGLEECWGTKERLDGSDLALGLVKATQSAYASIDDPKEGTILTVQKSMSKMAEKISKITNNPFIILLESFNEAKKSLKETHFLLPELKKAGTVDAGALAFVLIFEGFIEALFDEDIFTLLYSRTIDQELKPFLILNINSIGDKLNQKYEVQFNVESLRKSIDYLKSQLKTEGESLLITYDSETEDIRVHIHITQPVQDFLSKVEKLVGKLKNITILDLQNQNENFKLTLADQEGI